MTHLFQFTSHSACCSGRVLEDSLLCTTHFVLRTPCCWKTWTSLSADQIWYAFQKLQCFAQPHLMILLRHQSNLLGQAFCGAVYPVVAQLILTSSVYSTRRNRQLLVTSTSNPDQPKSLPYHISPSSSHTQKKKSLRQSFHDKPYTQATMESSPSECVIPS